MNNLTADQQAMLATWQQHTYAEFVLKDADSALATMTENPYLLMIATGTACTGRAAVREYYADQFLPAIPPDPEGDAMRQGAFMLPRAALELSNPTARAIPLPDRIRA